MIVCHCNLIQESEIEQVIVSMLDEDPWQLIVPLKVYHEMGKRGRCCGCFPGVVDIIIRVTAEYHRRHQTPQAEIETLVTRLSEINREREQARRENARRLAALKAGLRAA